MPGAEAGLSMGAEEMPSGDEFGAAAPAAGGAEAAGREMRENVQYSRRLATILSSKKK
jgi:ribosomal protein S6E (S10)